MSGLEKTRNFPKMSRYLAVLVIKEKKNCQNVKVFGSSIHKQGKNAKMSKYFGSSSHKHQKNHISLLLRSLGVYTNYKCGKSRRCSHPAKFI